MRTSHWGCPVVCGLALLAVSGCYSSSTYSPYGPYGTPSYYSTPPSYMQPGTPYAPGSMQPGYQSPTPADPGGGQWQQPFEADPNLQNNSTYPPNGFTPTYPPSGGVPNYNPNTGGTPTYNPPTTPTYNPPRGSAGGGSSGDDAFNSGNSFEEDGLVPMYEEPKPTRSRPTLPGTPPNESFDGGAPPFSSGLDNGSNFKSASSVPASGGLERFEAPVAVQRITLTNGTAPTTARKTVAEEPAPYSYDQAEYRWLRGTVDFDAERKTWNIIYSLDPDESDPYGGSLTLATDELLSGMQTGDCVLVQGKVDESITDEAGKPVYRVEHLGRIVPED